MAFNFNWSPLTADADFYQRARDLLTKALNKPPKPPIIVDDIVVTEFNLGTLPPDLEILEIGDLAEDRFRGIFKMCYSGDAVFTLKTRVQANPLNTYLYSKPSFTSPQPLAAASGLTIPLSITLSEIKLSAFIILVFSKQKGLTLVFRNDPLDSLKVSSTFDSIQFVRDYLQRTIEQRLRDLMMDELPAIIHRLSLRLWCPDQANKGTGLPPQEQDDDVKGVNPFASPPLDPVDAHGNPLDPGAVSELTLNGGEMQLLFSQKNLLRLAALTDCHRTLSVFTPGIRDAVFRAWCGCADRSDLPTPALATPSPITSSSFPPDGSTTYTFSDSGSAVQGSFGPRSSIVSLNSTMTGAPSSHGTGLRSRPGRKKKMRVVNLRRAKSGDDLPDDGLSDKTDNSSLQAPSSEMDAFSAADDHGAIRELDNDDLASAKVHFRPAFNTAAPASRQMPASGEPCSAADAKMPAMTPSLSLTEADKTMAEKSGARFAADSASVSHGRPSRSFDASSAILEQASIMKMAGEIARRIYEGKYQQSIWDEQDNPPPPAYEATSR